MNRRHIILCAAGVAVLVFVFALTRSHWRKSSFTREAQKVYSTSQRAYKKIELLPLADADQHTIRQVLSSTPFEPHLPPEKKLPLGNKALDLVLNHAADFIYYRFVNTSPTDYMQWRKSQGYHMRSLDELLDPWTIDWSYDFYFHKPFPDNPDLEAMFQEFWDIGLNYKNGKNKPTGIANDPAGLGAVAGIMTTGTPYHGEQYSGDLGSDLWYGSISSTMRCWWVPPEDTKTILAKHNVAYYIDVNCILSYADGTRRPLELQYVWNPDFKDWFLENVVISNFPSENLSGMEY